MRNYKVLLTTDLSLLDELCTESYGMEYMTHEHSSGITFKYFPEKVKNFVRSCKCIACGVEGNEVSIEKQNGIYHKIYGKPHLNVYANTYDEMGNKYRVLMTVDHDQLRSEGGADEAWNFNTMCTRCNQMRGSKWPELQDFLDHIEGRDLLREFQLSVYHNALSKKKRDTRGTNTEGWGSMSKEEREAVKAKYMLALHVSHVGLYNRHCKKELHEQQ